MENKIEMLLRQNRMLMKQILLISEDLELAHEKIAKLEKSRETGFFRTKNSHMRILEHI